MYRKIKDLATVRELLRNEAKLEDVASRMYNLDLRASGNDDLKTKCPFHEEDTPSFGIRKSKQLFNCFGCKTGGDVYKFVQLMDNVDHMEAIKRLAEFFSFDLKPYQEAYTEQERKQQELYNINVDVMEFCQSQSNHKNFDDWRKRRLFDRATLDSYGVGYCVATLGPDVVPSAGATEAQALGLDWETKWANTVVVPIRDHYGRVSAFRNRLLNPESQIKVIGPKEGHPLPVPSIYGLYEARQHIRSSGHLLLVEGEPDVWRLASSGYPNVAALLGTKLEQSTLQALESLAINKVTLLADNDDAGRKFSRRVAETHIGGKVLVRIATLSGNGKDPDEIVLADGPAAIQQAIDSSKFAFEFLIDRVAEQYDVSRPTDRLEVLNEVRPYFTSCPPIERELAARKLATLLSLDYEVVLDFLREAESGGQAELSNVAAERVVLKRMLLDEEFLGTGLLALKPADFFLSKHRHVFTACGNLFRRQQPVNPDIIITVLENDKLDGARSLIGGILSAAVDDSGAAFMLEDLRDKSLRREVRKTALEVANRLGDTKSDAKSVVQSLSAVISGAVVGSSQAIVPVSDVVFDRIRLMHDRIKNPNAIVGLDMGADFPLINHTIHGLQRKRYIVISAPSGVGKTATAGVLARRVCVELGLPGIYFTFETGTETLTDRLIASLSGVETDKVVTGHVTQAEARYVQEAAERVAASPLVLTERGVNFEECAAILRHDVLKRGTRIAFVDYIQLMNLLSADRMRRDQELGHISRGFLELSKELDLTIVVLAQQNRESTKAGSNEGTGIGESFKIFQDSDLFIVFREKTAEEIKADGPQNGNRKMKIAKHRHGKSGLQLDIMADLNVMRVAEVRSNQHPTR